MKKYTTTLVLFLCVVFTGLSQISITLFDTTTMVSGSVVDVNITPHSSTITELLIHNSAAVSKTYQCRRAILSMAWDDSTQFCFGGSCYSFSTNISTHNVTVAPGTTVDYLGNGFHCVFDAGGSCGTRLVYYRFEDVTNPADSASVIFRYGCATGIHEPTSQPTVSNAFPNPASSLVSFSYGIPSVSQKAKIVLYNLIGKEIKQITLNDKQGIAKLNTEDLPAGIYFYSLMVDDKMISTKKLVVSH